MSGHIFDMVNRIAQNKVRKRKKFKGNNRENIYSEEFDTVAAYNFPIVTEAELEDIRLQIKKRARKNQLISFYLLTASIILAAVAIWFFLQYFTVGSDRLY